MRAEFHAPLVFLAALVSVAAPAAASQAPGKLACIVDQRSPSDADDLLYERNYPEAERQYTAGLAADPASAEAVAGLVRVTLAEARLPDALALATRYDAAHPHNAVLLDALGEVRFRRGEVDEAASAFNEALHLDLCNAITHYDMYRFLNLSGMYASAQRHLDTAHALAPNNQRIKQSWHSSHQTPMTDQERLAVLHNRIDNPSITPEEKDGAQAAIAAITARERGDCQLVSPVAGAKIPMVPLDPATAEYPEYARGAGLDISFNGKRGRLEIDTGATGLLISRSVARAAGLVPELQAKATGIGDKGPASTFVTHVDDIRIGPMEFKNCMVNVLEQSSVIGVDGIIGPDVFRDYAVTLDFPSRELRLALLPPRPGDAAAQPASLSTSGDTLRQTAADQARDRYVAPEMKDWTPVFRWEHFLIFPTVIGNAPVKLFVMDTGASQGMISPDAAREVTHLSGDSDTQIRGINGDVKKVLAADKVSITFAHVRQITEGMTSFDSSSLGRSSSVEISGLIGFPTLRELIISIDYRDNLVHVVYDPKHGYHAH